MRRRNRSPERNPVASIKRNKIRDRSPQSIIDPAPEQNFPKLCFCDTCLRRNPEGVNLQRSAWYTHKNENSFHSHKSRENLGNSPRDVSSDYESATSSSHLDCGVLDGPGMKFH